MRKLLNTLYVTTPGSYLSLDGLALVIRREEQETARLPSHNFSGIVCFGRVSCSPYLMHFCAEQGILISFLDGFGRFLARVEGPVSGNVLLRREQYRIADSPERSARTVMMLVAGKIANQRAVLRRFRRDYAPVSEAMTRAESGLDRILENLRDETTVDALRGQEGKAADLYFSVFDELIRDRESPFRFEGRNRRPPLDMVNALLSYSYTLLLHETIAGLETVGLDPAVGFLHRDRPGRQSLALDLLEEFRPYAGDRFILSLINNKRLTPSDFETRANGAVYLNEEGRKKFLTAWQQRKQETLEHPFLKEKMPVGLLFFVQARLLAKYVRGEMDYYIPFVWK